MTPLEWRQAEAVLQELWRVPEPRREALLEARLDGQPELKRHVAALLAADRGGSVFLETPAAIQLTGPIEADLGSLLGSYRLRSVLGRGGMATVFLAERADDEFHKQVAVKIAHFGWRDEDLLRRFRGERQILAQLDHPNIAKLFDSGTTADGRPYFVMDYVDGLPIDEFCDLHHLTVAARLRLMRKVCAAVQYAHRHLVVHRDIKASNILVDAGGEPRLLDFGIAKILDTEAFGVAVESTRTRHRLMTPDCASPEQIRGEPITTASDVYSLGVLLYRLLTGRRPFRRRFPATDPHHLDAEPTRPSLAWRDTRPPSAVATDDGGPPEAEVESLPDPEVVARQRSVTPEQLKRQLRGDLDNVVVKALRASPDDRYRSVEQLDDDLRCHLEGLPVAARKLSVVDRVAKAVWRHPAVASLVLAVVVLLAGFAWSMAFQARRVARERDRAEQVTDFLVEVFREADPTRTRGETVTLREALENGAERVRAELGDQPQVRATLLGAIAEVFFSLALYDRATPLVEEAYELRRRNLPPDHPDLAASLMQVARIRRLSSDFAAEEALLRRAVEIRRRHFGERHRETALALAASAMEASRREDFELAEEQMLEAIDILRETPGTLHRDTATAINNLGTIYGLRGDLDRAEECAREAYGIRRQLYGDHHIHTATSLNNLAYALVMKGDFEKAAPLFRKSFEVFEEILGPDHPSLELGLNNLGSINVVLERWDEAENFFLRALNILDRSLGPDSDRHARTLSSLGELYQKTGRLDEAEPILRRSIAIYQAKAGTDSLAATYPLLALAKVLRQRGRLEEADAILRHCLELRESKMDPSHPDLLELRGYLESIAEESR